MGQSLRDATYRGLCRTTSAAFATGFAGPLCFGSSHDSALIGRHAGGPSEDCGEIIKQFRLRLQLRLEATREVRDTIGSGKAEPLGELGQSGLCVAAAQPRCDRPCYVGVVTLRKQGGFVEIRHGSEDSFRAATREPPRFGDG
jgi:hypothetical protein